METQQTTQNNQPVDEFIVKVKLLSNQVYDFVINPESTKVSQLKKMIMEKINIPIERQRIVFGGKQLVDQNKVTEYVKESGLTVHLIAKTNQPQSNTSQQTSQTQQQTQQQSQQQTGNNGTNPQNSNQRQQSNTQPNPFGNIMSMIGTLGGSNPQATTMTFSNMGDLNQSLGGLLGSLGLRIPTSANQPNTTQNRSTNPQTQQPTHDHLSTNPFQTPPTNTNRSTQQGNQPTSMFSMNNNTNIRQQENQPTNNQTNNQNINTNFNVSNQPILQLNQTISTLNLPSQPVLDNRHMSLRQQTAQYLRRLQHQYMRMIPQLNRSIQLLNQGRVTHMSQVLKLFEAIDGANKHAQEAIKRLINLPANQQQSSTNNNNFLNTSNQNPLESTQTTTTIINNQQNNQNNTNNLQQNQAENHIQIQVESHGDEMMDLQDILGNSQGLDGANVQATIIIQEGDILDDDIDQQPTNFNTNNQQNRGNQSSTNPRILSSGTTTINLGNLGSGGLSSLLGGLTGQMNQNQPQTSQTSGTQPMMGGGFNLGSLMSMFGGGGSMGINMNMNQGNRQNQPTQVPPQNASTSQNTQQNIQQTNQQQRSQQNPSNLNSQSTSQSQQPINQQGSAAQFPQIDLSNIASMASMLFTQPPQQTTTQNQQQQNPSTNTQQQAQNPLAGMNLMGIFNSLQQSGGMGQLMNMSIGDMLQQGSGSPTIYSTIFKSFVGSDLINCFTSKNFDFLDRKYQQVRQNVLRAVSLSGSQQDLIESIAIDITQLLIPDKFIKNQEECFQQVSQIIRKYVSQVIRITLSKGDAKYSEKVTGYLKQAFCQAIQKISALIDTQKLENGQTAQRLVFQNLKNNSIQLMNQFIEGLSGMFYGFIQRDLIRVYNEYKQQQKRKKQRSSQQIATQEELLKQIDQQSKKDIEYLKNFKHSQYYLPKSQ